MTNLRIVSRSLVFTGIFSLLPVVFPNLDLIISGLFFSKENGFYLKNNFFVYGVYAITPILTKIFIGLCCAHATIIWLKARSLAKVIRIGSSFLIIAAILGPGLVVNSGLKEFSGRARPREIEQFSGNKEFSKPFLISDQCKRNCSLSSGHAAMGYFFTGIAYTVKLRYFTATYCLGLLFGSFVGLSRIMMGGHFFSDVMFSAFIVLLINHIMYYLWQHLKKSSKK